MPNMNYNDIQQILDNYEARKRWRRKQTGDLEHIVKIKAALLKSILAVKELYGEEHSALIIHGPGFTRADKHFDLRIRNADYHHIPYIKVFSNSPRDFDYKLIEIFVKFYDELLKIISSNPKGKGSVEALQKIKLLIEYSDEGKFAIYWKVIAPWLKEHSQNRQEHDECRRFFTNLYFSRLNSSQSGYNDIEIDLIKKSIEDYLVGAKSFDIKNITIPSPGENKNVEKCVASTINLFREIVLSSTNDPVDMARAFYLYYNANSARKFMFMLNTCYRNNIKLFNHQTLQLGIGDAKNLLIGIEEKDQIAFWLGRKVQLPEWLTQRFMIELILDQFITSPGNRLEALVALDKHKLLTSAILDKITQLASNYKADPAMYNIVISAHEEFDSIIIELSQGNGKLTRQRFDFILNELSNIALHHGNISKSILQFLPNRGLTGFYEVEANSNHLTSLIDDLIDFKARIVSSDEFRAVAIDYTLSFVDIFVKLNKKLYTPHNVNTLKMCTPHAKSIIKFVNAMSLNKFLKNSNRVQLYFDNICHYLGILERIDYAMLAFLPDYTRGTVLAEIIFEICQKEQGDAVKASTVINRHIQHLKDLKMAEELWLTLAPNARPFPEGLILSIKYHPILSEISQNPVLGYIPPHSRNSAFMMAILEICRREEGNLIGAREAVNQYINQLWVRIQAEQNLVQHQRAEINRFNPLQSTHTASVHDSVSESAIKLKKYYTQRGNLIDILDTLSAFKVKLEDMRDTIKVWENDTDPEKSLKFLEIATALKVVNNLISSHLHHNHIDQKSQVSTNELLAMAILSLDEPDIRRFDRPDGSHYVTDRDDAQNRIIRCLYEVGRGYNLDDEGNDLGGADSNICTAGTFNKIMESLVSTISLVEITVITKEYALAKLKALVIEAVKAYLQSLPVADDENRKIVVSLLADLKKNGVEIIWDKIKKGVLDAYFSEFSRLYTNDTGVVDMNKIQTDVEGAGPYTDISDIIKAFKKTLKSPSPASSGLFADQSPEPASNQAKLTNTLGNKK